MFAQLPVVLLAAAGAQASYAPQHGACPTDVALIRHAGTAAAGNQSVGQQESSYISSRRSQVAPHAYRTFLQNVQAKVGNGSLPDYVTSILSNASTLPRLGIATSGGGSRAAIFGAGVLSAFDSRNASANSAGTGGVLQAADYLAGLSGGSWLVTSLAQANFPQFRDLALVGSGDFGGWQSAQNVLAPSNSGNGSATSALDTAYYAKIFSDMGLKLKAGFPVTFGDFWARALSWHFVNGTTSANFFDFNASHGADITFSSIAKLPSFTTFEQPFPIILFDSQSPGQNSSELLPQEEVPLTNTIYEANVYEMGSWDPMLASFTPTQLLGTSLTGGSAKDNNSCVTGFDNAGFLTGTSSNLWAEFNTSTAAFFNNSLIGQLTTALHKTFGGLQINQQLDISAYPNPFEGLGVQGQYLDQDQTQLRLLDGGLDGEVTPYMPLLVPARKMDVIIGIDASADTASNYANGSSVIATRKRTSLFGGAFPFPAVPTSADTFVSQNFTTRPAFFGCNDTSTPLLVYIANGPTNTVTNTSTFQDTYSDAQVSTMLDHAFADAAGGGGEAQWPACLACAVVDRARARVGAARSGVCEDCFNRLCWNGEEAVAGGGKSSGSNGTPLRGISIVLTSFVAAVSLGLIMI